MKAMLVSEHECANIVKCLAAEYEQVILCSPEKKILENVRKLSIQRFDACYTEKVLFLLPEEVLSFLERESIAAHQPEKRVKGYRVSVQYQPVDAAEQQTKREAVGQVIVQSLRRLKGNKNK